MYCLINTIYLDGIIFSFQVSQKETKAMEEWNSESFDKSRACLWKSEAVALAQGS